MKIVQVKLRLIRIPFQLEFKHSLKSSTEVYSLILELYDEQGHIGFGEAIPRDYVTGETVESVQKHFSQILINEIHGLEFNHFDEIKTFILNFYQTYPSIQYTERCVLTLIDLALLDLWGKNQNQSIIQDLGIPLVQSIAYSAVLPSVKLEALTPLLQYCNKMGLDQIKLKVGLCPESDLAAIQLCQKIIGPDLKLRVDANSSWTLAQAQENLKAYHKLGVISCEEPLKVEACRDYPILFSQFKNKLHISLDESAVTANDIQKIADTQMADMINMRVSKMGGIIHTLNNYQLAHKLGLNSQLGSQVGETSLLSAAGRIFACLTGDLVFHEGSFGKQLLKQDLSLNSFQFVPKGHGPLEEIQKNNGLGVQVDHHLLDQITETILTVGQ
jgi:L-alanine-DL-glutamate epimerase-like enolase superfamily enzyme